MEKNESVWMAVVNPAAGAGKTLGRWRSAERVLFDHKVKYHYITPESPSDSYFRIVKACHDGYRRFIAVGGDGTVHNLMGSIAKFVMSQKAEGKDISLSDFTLVAIPIGSGNDWLRSHNIPCDYNKIVGMMARGEFHAQDVAKAEVFDPDSGKIIKTSYMANVGGYNFDANVCEVVNAQKKRGIGGKLLYLKALLKMAARQKAYPTRIVCDGATVFDDLCYTISIGNGLYSGGGLCQTPSAVMDDGMLNMMIAPKFPIIRLFTNVHKLLQKRTEEIPFLKFHSASCMEIIPQTQGQLVEIDGDIIGRAPVRITVLPERINVLHCE